MTNLIVPYIDLIWLKRLYRLVICGLYLATLRSILCNSGLCSAGAAEILPSDTFATEGPLNLESTPAATFVDGFPTGANLPASPTKAFMLPPGLVELSPLGLPGDNPARLVAPPVTA